MLTLNREAEAAMVEAQVWEDAEEKQAKMENKNSVSDKVKLQRTSEYVQSQIDLQKQSPPPLLTVPRVEPVPKAEPDETMQTWQRTMNVPKSQPTCSKPNSERGCGAQPPVHNLPESIAV